MYYGICASREFGISIRKLSAPSLVISIGKVHVFMSNNVANTCSLATFTCRYVLILQVKLLSENWKRTFKTSFLSRKQLESESLAEIQFVIDSCRLVSQLDYFNNSNKECDWLILACFIRDEYTAEVTFTPLENKVWFENSANACGN